jgi:hypothetical protein
MERRVSLYNRHDEFCALLGNIHMIIPKPPVDSHLDKTGPKGTLDAQTKNNIVSMILILLSRHDEAIVVLISTK